MEYRMFTVHDVKAEAFLLPFFARSRGEAVRMFETAVNTPDHQFARHASDFTLFEIGHFNDLTGEVGMHDALLSLGSAVQYIRQVELPMFDRNEMVVSAVKTEVK